MDALGYVGWGSGPVIGVSFAYERWRVGAAMQYRVQVTVNPVSGASSFGYPIYLGLYINGVVRTSVTLKAASPSRWTSAIVWTSDWYTVADKTSGTTPVSFNLYSGSGSSRNNTYSYAMAVDPAASTLTVASGTLGQAQTLTLTRYSAAFKDTITWTCGTASGTIAALSQETSFSFTPPMDLAAQAPNAAAVEIRFAVSTYQADGTTLVATSSTTIAAAIPETVKPSCALAVSDPTGSLSAYGAYVQGRSRLHLVVTPTLAYGSEIASYQIVADGKTYTASDVTTDPIAGSGTLTLTARVTDRRGRTSDAAAVTITVLPCAAPQISSFTAQRCGADGTPDEEGLYIKVTFSAAISPLNNQNTTAYRVRYKKTGTEDWTTVTLTDYAGQYAVSSGTTVFAAAAADAWDVQISAQDAFAETAQTRSVPIAFSLVNYNASGKGLAFGRISQIEGAFEVDMPARFYKGVNISSPLGLESGGVGAADADGARENLVAVKRPKLLWSGSWTSGSITVSGFSTYKLLLAQTTDGDSAICWKDGSLLLGGGLYPLSGTGGQMAYSFRAGFSANTLTLQNSYALVHGINGSHSGQYTRTVKAIYGLLLNDDVLGEGA